MKITKVSSFTGKTHTMDLDITQEQLDDWKNTGKLIQKAFPNLTDEEREFLLTGVTPEEWNEAFREEGTDE